MATAGPYDPNGAINWGALFQNALGQQTTKDSDSEQHTTNTQNQTNQGTQNTTGNQQITGTQTTGGSTAQNQQQTSNTDNQTRGVVVNQTATHQDSTTSRQGNSTESVSADVAGLRQILAKQMAGISPEMLQAIFSEGSKAAPQIMASQATALGARMGNNTPLAQSLNMLNGQLTAKAADVNLQMLRDATGTAGKIADMTRTTSQSFSDTSNTIGDTTQAQVTTTLQSQVMNQLLEGTTNSTNNQVTNNNQNTTNNSSVTNNATSNTTSTQDVTAAQNDRVLQTVNMNIARGLAGGLAAGVGIDELFRAATGQGFTGNLQQFIRFLTGGTNVTGGALGGDVLGGSLPAGVGYDAGGGGFEETNPFLNNEDFVAADTVPSFDLGFADGGQIPEFKSIIKQDPALMGGQFDIGKLIDGLLAQGIAQHQQRTTGGQQNSSVQSSRANLTEEEMSGAAADRETSAEGDSETTKQGSGANWRTDKVGAVTRNIGRQAATGNGESMTEGAYDPALTDGFSRYAGTDGVDNIFDTYDAKGNYLGTGRWSRQNGLMEDLVFSAAAMLTPGAGMIMGASAADAAGQSGDIGGMLQGILQAAAGATGSSTLQNINRGVGVVRRVTGRADGGVVRGPGTGISDEVEAHAENGQPIRLSAGEFILPADTVTKLGVDFLEDIVEQTHVPAAMQRAMGGR